MLSRNLRIYTLCAVGICGVVFWQRSTHLAGAQNVEFVPSPTRTPRPEQISFVEGRVFDARTKTAVVGARVSIEFIDYYYETKTDAAGHYRIENIAPGQELAYAVGAKGYSFRSNYGANEDSKVVAPASGLKLDFALLRDSSIGGQVRDSAGQPIAGAHVQIFSLKADNNEIEVTDKNGYWKVEGLDVPFPQGAIDLEVEAFDPRFSQVETKAKIRAGAQTNFPMTMPARAIISGVITRNGKPLPNAVVMLDKSEGNGFINDDPNYGLPPDGAATDKNGRYRLLASAPRTYVVGLYEDDSISQQVKLTTKPGQNLVVNRDLKPIPYGSIRGRVIDLSGRPVAGSSASLWNGDTVESLIFATTDAAGRFSIPKVAPRDDYYISVDLPDSQYSGGARSDTLRVRPYQTKNVTIRIDTIKPTVAAIQPPRVVSETMRVRFDASDNVGVWVVQAKLDGQTLNSGRKELSAEFDEKQPRQTRGAFDWNSRGAANGRHTLSLVATDRAGNQTTRQWFIWIQNKRTPVAK